MLRSLVAAHVKPLCAVPLQDCHTGRFETIMSQIVREEPPNPEILEASTTHRETSNSSGKQMQSGRRIMVQQIVLQLMDGNNVRTEEGTSSDDSGLL